MTLYATLYEDGNTQPVGFKGEPTSYPGLDEDAETRLRLDLALELLAALGYEAHFGSEPVTDVEYEEVS